MQKKQYDDGDIFAVDTAGDRKLYALWIPAEYKITYESNGGSKVDGSTYTILDTVTLPVAEKENYIFAGWYKDPRFEGGKTEVLSGSHGDKQHGI